MEPPPIPQDDILDVMEMTQKLEAYITTVIKDSDRELAMSALMSACVNCILYQCKTFEEVLFYRTLFMQILDGSISTIQIKGPETPS